MTLDDMEVEVQREELTSEEQPKKRNAMDNIEVEFCEDHAKKRKTSDVEFKNDSFGELIIQPAQSILKKKKSVSFVILETDEVITINDDEEDDDLPIATRIRKMKRNKKKAASPLPSKSTKSKNQMQVPDLTDPLLMKIFEDNISEDFLGFDPLYNPYIGITDRPSVLVQPSVDITYFDRLRKVYLNITKDDETCVDWLRKMKLIAPDNSPCPTCEEKGRDGFLRYYHSAATDRKAGTFLQCTGVGSRCRKRYSPFTNTFFDGGSCKIELGKAIEVIWCWIYRMPISSCVLVSNVVDKTAIDYYNFCREICAVSLSKRNQDIIGGVGTTVEIDESKLFKRKYNRGRFLSMQEGWAFGGVCRETFKKFVELVPDRSEATLLPIIQRHIKPGTHIMSDEWRAYFNLNKYGYIHDKINHSENFVNPEDPNIHTQRIENAWRYLKQTFPNNGTSEDMRESYLQEYVYRECHKENFINAFFEDMRQIYPWMAIRPVQ